MMTFNSAFRRLAFGLLVSTSGLGLAQVATASVDIETPPLRAVNDAHVCRVTNLNSSTVSVGDLVMLEGVNQVECQSPQPLNLAPGQTAELSCPVAGDFPGVVAYCLVNVPSATIANNMAVSLQLEDANGTALAAVQGLTTTSNLGGGRPYP